MSVHVQLYPHRFQAWTLLQAFEARHIKHNKYGANTLFIGRMRDFNQNQNVTSMHLEHYPGMTEKELSRLANRHLEESLQSIKQVVKADNESNQAHSESSSEPPPTVLICHRVGYIEPSDDIVIVAAWSAHRAQAFYLCQNIMEDLKSKAPFWKQEQSNQGQTYWVQP